MFARTAQGGRVPAERRRDYKKGIVGEDSRRRREDARATLRKQRQEDALQKRRHLVEADVPSLDSVGAKSAELAPSLDTLPAHVQVVMSAGLPDGSLHVAAVQAIRKLLSVETNPPIAQVIASGVVPRLVELLDVDAMPQLQFEAAWALTNVASGTSEQTHCVLEHGVVPPLVRLMLSPEPHVKEQAVWGLGNVAGDCPQFRDYCLEHGMLRPLLAVLQDPASASSLMHNAVWALSNLCRGKPQPPFVAVAPALPVLAALLHSDDQQVVTDALWTLSYLSDGPNENIARVLSSGCAPTLAQHLMNPSFLVQTPALRTVGNIVTGSDDQTQQMIDAGSLPALGSLLGSSRKTLRKEAAWALSNITAGNAQQTQRVFDTVGVLPEVCRLLGDGDYEVRKECTWVVSNATAWRVPHQIRTLVRVGAVASLCDFLKTADAKTISVIIEAMDNILEVGNQVVVDGKATHNEFYDVFDEADGLERLEVLQDHASDDVYEKAISLLEKYFAAKEEGAATAGENAFVPNIAQHGSQQFTLAAPPGFSHIPSTPFAL